MTSTLRAVAESRFAAITRREEAAMSDIESEQQAMREKTERLRAQRLAHHAKITAEHTARMNEHRKAPHA